MGSFPQSSPLYKKPFVVCGCNHTTAPVAVRELLTRVSQKVDILTELRTAFQAEEIALVSTCNRFELIVVGDKVEQETIVSYLNEHAHGLLAKEHMYWYRDRQAVHHLFRVAASLDSMVLGEGQILGQLKEAYNRAQRAGTVKKLLHSLFQFSFQVAKRVRSNTPISQRGISVSYIAVQLAQQIFTDLSKASALILGSGRMAELVALHLASLGCKEISVANRTEKKARELALRVGGASISLKDIPDVIREKDLIIGSLSIDKPLVTEDLLARRTKTGPLFFIDLGVPRNFSPNLADHSNVYLYDIDALSHVAQQNRAHRERAAKDAELILEYGVYRFEAWLEKLAREPSVLELRSLIEKICTDVVESSPNKQSTDLSRQISARLSHELLHGEATMFSFPNSSFPTVVDEFLELDSGKD